MLLALAVSSGTAAVAQGPLVAVIDSGVDATHPDLTGRVVAGFNFVANNTNTQDLLGHGTEMAGLIAASGTVQGACPTCRILPLKVADDTHAVRQDHLSQAIDYAVNNGAQVIYVGAGSAGVEANVRTSIDRAEAAGIPVVAPTGNGEVMHTAYPAALPSVLSVVATDAAGSLLRPSSTSGRETLAAAADKLVTTALGSGTVERSGSSVAAARVAGLVGQLLIQSPNLALNQIRQVLRYGTDPFAIPGWTDLFEQGVSNTQRSLARSAVSFPDIALRSVTAFPAQPLPGQPRFARLRLVNQGNVATGTVTVDLQVDGAPGPTVSVANLNLGEAREVDVNLPAAAATQQVVATARPLTGETETGNNTASVTIPTAAAVHDVTLRVGALSEPVIEAGSVSFPVTVINRGNQVENAVSVQISVDGTVVDSRTLSLGVGASTTYTGIWPLGPQATLGIHSLKIAASLPAGDADPVGNEWFYDLQIGRRADPASLQYADTDGITDIVMDAPWKTIRNYVPVLIFTPQFPRGSRRIDKITLRRYNVVTGTPGANLYVDRRSGADLIPFGTSIINPDGFGRAPINTAEVFDSFWHYIVRLPTAVVGAGERYIKAEVEWSKVVFIFRPSWTYKRVLRILVEPTPFPRFDPQDRYYDAHVHTIAEQTTRGRFNVDGGNKNFGGPIAMLLEASFALGLVETQLNNANWLAFRDRVVVTDHNVFYSRNPGDDPSAPLFGPTRFTNGHAGEAAWYRQNLGRLAGEEVALRRGSNQDNSSRLNVGHHFLAYDTLHFEGPWHGGLFITSGTENPNTMLSVLGRMRAHNATGFGYAAHPFHDAHRWPPEYFCQAIGFPVGGDCTVGYNSRSGSHVNSTSSDFIYKGSQVWNTKPDFVARRNENLSTTEFEDMNPFNGGNFVQRFVFNPERWDELEHSQDHYNDRLKRGLVYSFREEPDKKFIRKIYMSAGTDAHGDFNYTDDVSSTVEAMVSSVGSLNSSAYARVCTYTLVHDRPSSGSGEQTSHDAYREGNTILTDGPICKYNLDSDGRHNTQPGANPRWHDARNEWENPEGRIGGLGRFDGGRTVLVPRRAGTSVTNVFMQSRWKGGSNGGPPNPNIPTYELTMIRPSSPTSRLVPAGAEDTDVEQMFPANITEMSAIIQTGRDTGRDERCISNPIWSVPVPISVSVPQACPIGPGQLTVTFDFPISMSANAGVFVRHLNGAGDSTDPEYALTGSWSDLPGVFQGRYTATNPQTIPCSPQDWDADTHQPVPNRKSYVTYMVAPQELHNNTLNDIGRTFVTVPHEEEIHLVEPGVQVDTGAIDTSGYRPAGPFTFYTWPAGTIDMDGIVNDDPPTGLKIDAKNGAMYGITQEPGTYHLMTEVKDAKGETEVFLWWKVLVEGDDDIPHYEEIHIVESGEPVDTGPVDPSLFGNMGPYSFDPLPAGSTQMDGIPNDDLPPGLTIDPDTGAMSGTTTETGIYHVLCVVTDAEWDVYYLWWKVVVDDGRMPHYEEIHILEPGQQIDTGPVTLPDLGGVPPHTFTVLPAGAATFHGVTNDDLPTGLSFDPATGAMTGSTEEEGIHHVLCVVQDSEWDVPAYLWWKFVVDDGEIPHYEEIHIVSAGQAFDTGPVSTADFGGSAPYSFQMVPADTLTLDGIANDDLPAGLTMDGSTGAVRGSTKEVGTFHVLCLVQDSEWDVYYLWWKIIVDDGKIPHVEVIHIFQQGEPVEPEVVDASGAFTFEAVPAGTVNFGGVTNDGLPAGLSVDNATGAVIGTPEEPGTFKVLCLVLDRQWNPVAYLWWKIVVDNGKIPHIEVVHIFDAGEPVDTGPEDTSQFGGQGPYRFEAAAPGSVSLDGIGNDALPQGLSINPTTGAVNGTPQEPGTAKVLCLVFDSEWQLVAYLWWKVVVDDGKIPHIEVVHILVAGEPVDTGPEDTSQFGGQGPYRFEAAAPGSRALDGISNDALPRGLSLNPSTGAVTGTPEEAGTSKVLCLVFDSEWQLVAYLWWKTVVDDGDIPHIEVVHVATPGQTISTAAVDTSSFAGSGPYTFQAAEPGTASMDGISNDALPAGLTLDPNTGALFGSTDDADTSHVLCLTFDQEWNLVAYLWWKMVVDELPHITVVHDVPVGEPLDPQPVDPGLFDSTRQLAFMAVEAGMEMDGRTTDPLPASLGIDRQTGALTGVLQPGTGVADVAALAFEEETWEPLALLWWTIVPRQVMDDQVPVEEDQVRSHGVDPGLLAGSGKYRFTTLEPGAHDLNGQPNHPLPKGLAIDTETGAVYGSTHHAKPGTYHLLCSVEDMATGELVAYVHWRLTVREKGKPAAAKRAAIVPDRDRPE